jgi:hypothetical protein
MSSISGITSTPYQNQSQSQSLNGYGQAFQNFKAIGSALQSGDLSTAQTALTSFQQALSGSQPASSSSQTSSTKPFGSNNQANNDFQNLTTALKSSDLASAQKAFTSLQNDLKSTQSTKSTQATRKGHHHHHSTATDSTTASTTSSSSSAASNTNSSTNQPPSTDSSLNVTA